MTAGSSTPAPNHQSTLAAHTAASAARRLRLRPPAAVWSADVAAVVVIVLLAVLGVVGVVVGDD